VHDSSELDSSHMPVVTQSSHISKFSEVTI
jgi:hypothetical protein